MPRSADLRALLAGPVLEVAPRLLGSTLRHGPVACRITEVEAYDGANDPGSHAARGRTPRNAVMFGEPGHLYVYFTYGMHFCCNVVCGPERTASAVLLRAGAIVAGREVARERRATARTDRDLARGPARLCQALSIGRDQNGHDLTREPLVLEPGPPVREVLTGPRVGLREAPDRPWRFWLPGEPSVSAYRPATRRGVRP
ncbi:MAG TPA: DNA-3-methyladenine glycosylase [Nocardioides sp.]|uniref:DNA-3-methyladenine glycosylase n=1 Tax=Nocardioides sp. TaxID=35761 RepID=UPI002E331B95|nr:DNA-3-methyladenine glycosylase [Nocardioides sp.]HEX3931141.1 DNA-3-methyladenine glycosylase [Nocardioides sp.]